MEHKEVKPEEWEIPKSLANVATGGTYFFHLKTGVKLELDDWTLDAELWASQRYGTMDKLFNTLMGIDVKNQDVIDASIKVAAYKLTDESRKIVDELRGKEPIELWLAKQMTYKLLVPLIRAQFQMIRDSVPIEALEEVKKKHLKIFEEKVQGNRASQRAKLKSKKKKKK